PALEDVQRRERGRERALAVAAERLAADVDRHALEADARLEQRIILVEVERIRVARFLPGERDGVARGERLADRTAADELDPESVARKRGRIVELEQVAENGDIAPVERVRAAQQHEVALPLADRRIGPEDAVHLVRVGDIELRLAEP